MPLYSYKCSCGKSFDRFLKIAEMQRFVQCECRLMATRQVVAPAVRGDYPPYECPVTGKVIEGRVAHEENLKRTGSRVLEPGEAGNVSKYRAAEEAKFDAAIEATADEFITNLPVEKRERLAAEMDAGVDAVVERQTVSQ